MNAQGLPKGYKKGIPRVSEIVDFVFPFKGDSVNLNVGSWLDRAGNPLEKDAQYAYSSDTPYLALAHIYLEEAQRVGTFVHRQMELFVLGEPLEDEDELYKNNEEEINNGLEFISSKNVLNPEVEKYIRDSKDRYQGSIDLVANLDDLGKTIVDYKTYGIARKRFGIPFTSNYKKPYDKLKKARLQLSLYAYAIGDIDTICIYEATNGGHLHTLEKYTDKQIESILEAYKLSKNIESALELLD